jgi:hypothetical protein
MCLVQRKPGTHRRYAAWPGIFRRFFSFGHLMQVPTISRMTMPGDANHTISSNLQPYARSLRAGTTEVAPAAQAR